jgi:hypothetical protein
MATLDRLLRVVGEVRMNTLRKALEISANFLSVLAGVPATKLHRGLTGVRQLENPDAIKLLETLALSNLRIIVTFP